MVVNKCDANRQRFAIRTFNKKHDLKTFLGKRRFFVAFRRFLTGLVLPKKPKTDTFATSNNS